MKTLRNKIHKILLEHYLQENVNNAKKYKLDIYVPENVKNIKDSLRNFGYTCYMIGGCVRDAILNKSPKDYDLVTDALPDSVIQILKNEHYVKHILETGKKFGIINVITKNGEEYEIAAFREDVSTGRHPEIKLNATMESDSKRRDLTINSLYYDIDKREVIDFNGGFEDLKNGKINTVGDPNERFQEDALRLIRIIRFFCRLDNAKFDKQTVDAIKNNLHLLSEISAERIRDEFLKGVYGSKDVVKYLTVLYDFGFFHYIFGSLIINKKYFIHERNSLILLANILKDNNKKDIQQEMSSKRYTINEVNCIAFFVSIINLSSETVSELKKLYAQKLKILHIKDMVYEFATINKISKFKIDNFFRLVNEFSPPSELLISLEYKGRDFGIAIEKLEKAFYKNPDRIKAMFDSSDTEEIKKIVFSQE